MIRQQLFALAVNAFDISQTRRTECPLCDLGFLPGRRRARFYRRFKPDLAEMRRPSYPGRRWCTCPRSTCRRENISTPLMLAVFSCHCASLLAFCAGSRCRSIVSNRLREDLVVALLVVDRSLPAPPGSRITDMHQRRESVATDFACRRFARRPRSARAKSSCAAGPGAE